MHDRIQDVQAVLEERSADELFKFNDQMDNSRDDPERREALLGAWELYVKLAQLPGGLEQMRQYKHDLDSAATPKEVLSAAKGMWTTLRRAKKGPQS
ncbi:hypothetical protein AB0I72_27405 [Nocardiopsis sp. NPDC049922]|uniref:hypothetical protein n=1 Tax=Nocardiopsis sp. NPDC049922 TaxID=3155157 RepID=UPI0033CCE1F9